MRSSPQRVSDLVDVIPFDAVLFEFLSLFGTVRSPSGLYVKKLCACGRTGGLERPGHPWIMDVLDAPGCPLHIGIFFAHVRLHFTRTP